VPTVAVRGSFDETIARLAVHQHGVVTRRQLVEAGVTSSGIRHRLTTRRLHTVHRGVYAVGHPLLPLEARYMAAVLACGDRAVLSHADAGTLLGLLPLGSGAIHVTTPRLGIPRTDAVRVHRSRRLHPDEITVCEGIPCTTVARTLVDLAVCATSRQVRRALEQSLVLGGSTSKR
jgi:predicted transcriptional regulator of viral defense system